MKKLFFAIIMTLSFLALAGCANTASDAVVSTTDTETTETVENEVENVENEESSSTEPDAVKDELTEEQEVITEQAAENESQQMDIVSAATEYNRDNLTPEQEAELRAKYGFVPDGFYEDGVPYKDLG